MSGFKEIQPTFQKIDQSTENICKAINYTVAPTSAETCGWLTALLAQIIAKYRASEEFHLRMVCRLDAIMNQRLPSFIAPVKINSLKMGEKYPILNAASTRLVAPKNMGTTGQFATELVISYNDKVSIGVSTALLFNMKGTCLASLPVELTVSIVHFSGILRVELGELASKGSHIAISVLDNFNIDFEVETSVGSHTRINNLPRVTTLIINRLKNFIIEKFVFPNCQKFPLTMKGTTGTTPSSIAAEGGLQVDTSAAMGAGGGAPSASTANTVTTTTATTGSTTPTPSPTPVASNAPGGIPAQPVLPQPHVTNSTTASRTMEAIVIETASSASSSNTYTAATKTTMIATSTMDASTVGIGRPASPNKGRGLSRLANNSAPSVLHQRTSSNSMNSIASLSNVSLNETPENRKRINAIHRLGTSQFVLRTAGGAVYTSTRGSKKTNSPRNISSSSSSTNPFPPPKIPSLTSKGLDASSFDFDNQLHSLHRHSTASPSDKARLRKYPGTQTDIDEDSEVGWSPLSSAEESEQDEDGLETTETSQRNSSRSSFTSNDEPTLNGNLVESDFPNTHFGD